jgi:D-alanyl-lipoteichoic acid acyltransferase DltB (MBOAT superfamily)
MLIGGLWHGANIRFLIWGALHGFGLIINKFWKFIIGNNKPARGLEKFIFQFITFQFVTFAWIFFRSQNLSNAFQIINQILHHFQLHLIPEILRSYPSIITILIAGFSIHWLPYSIKEKYRGWFITTPIYVKAIFTILAVILIAQVKSSVIQPFIYFQF